MDLFVWDCLLCLLPSLFLFLLCLILRLPRAPRWTRPNVRTPGPRFICKHTALAKHLQHCVSLTGTRPAPWPRGDPHLQTLSSLLFGEERHRHTIQFSRDNLLLRDGGIVAVDWAVGTRAGEAAGRRKLEGKTLGCFTSTPPVLLLIPHYWGGMTPHLKALCHRAVSQGFYVAVFHPRGTAGCPLTTTRLTEFGDPADLQQAVAYIHSRHPSSVMVAVSEGSGSGILLSYLGECGSSTILTAAAAISPVLLGQEWFETSMPLIYHWGALFHRKLQLKRYANSFRSVLDVDRVLGSSSLRDLEESLFCSPGRSQQRSSGPGDSLNSGLSSGPASPWGLAPSVAWVLGDRAQPAQDWLSYWERNEPLRDADEVAVPVLCICSHDDPLLPHASTLPISLFQNNPYFLLVLTDKGGHCGFTVEGGEEMEGNWSHMVVLEYFKVVADFLKGGERNETSWAGLMGESGSTGLRSRTNNKAPPPPPPPRRRTTVMRRQRPQGFEQTYVEVEENFTWKRSYTR